MSHIGRSNPTEKELVLTHLVCDISAFSFSNQSSILVIFYLVGEAYTLRSLRQSAGHILHSEQEQEPLGRSSF